MSIKPLSSSNLCQNCKYYDQFTGVCCNANSPYRADFVDEENVCEEWEQ